MLRKLLLGVMLFTLTSCAMMPGNSGTQPTPLPTFTPGVLTTPDPGITQAVVLGGKKSGDLYVWIYSDPNPPKRGDNSFEAFIADADGQPISEAKISFDVDMTNMSHGKTVIVMTSTGNGHYSGKIHFLMPGPWRIIVGIERQGQTNSSVRFDFNVK